MVTFLRAATNAVTRYINNNGNNHCHQINTLLIFKIIDGTSYERYRPAFKEFYSMGEEARRLKNMRSVNGTLFLIDSTLDDWHDSSINPNLNPEDQVN